MILVDLTHTSHSRARTGIQRVARALLQAKGSIPICHDPYARAWRPLRKWEQANLASEVPGQGGRSARWPMTSRLAGVLQRGGGRAAAVRLPAPDRKAALLVPEIFSPAVAGALPALFDFVSGPRAAIFHDAIALKLPEYTPAKTVARFPSYLEELRRFDGIAAVSRASRDALLGYWRWLGIADHPPVEAIPLGVDLPRGAAEGNAGRGKREVDGGRPIVLCVGTIEGRKNHLSLLEACESLWSGGLEFELRLVGLPRPETAAPALERIAALRAAGRPIRSEGVVSDPELEAAYAGCTFTIYPSIMEGFGLPVLESVMRGKPCICSEAGALGESAAGGGCVALAEMDAPSLARAIRQLLEKPAAIEKLAQQARERPIRDWDRYAVEIGAWLASLSRR